MMISVVIPVYNGSTTLDQCLTAVTASDYHQFECIVIDDGSTDNSRDIVRQHSTRLVTLEGGQSGPAHARNRGAEIALGDILFFIDADVVIQPDTLTKVADSFKERPQITALFGSYDESPAGMEFLTQYKNLVHHFVHQQGHEKAATFWTGCGAIRRDIFLEFGGFDKERYPQPSIEDIELGYRLTAAGHEIYLNKNIQVKHLKKWSLKGLVKTDIFSRALPWTQLIMQHQNMPNDLNLQVTQKLSAFLLCLLLLFLTLNIFQENFFYLPLLTALFLLVVNGWHWRTEPTTFKMSLDMETAAYTLLGIIGLLAFYGRLPQLLLPASLLLLVILVGRFLPLSNPVLRKTVFVAMMMLLAAMFTVLLVSYPVWLAAPILLLLLVIIVLNRQLYLFFARKRGIVFALAALPFQLFYYFYSVVTFVVSSGLHKWHHRLQPR